MIGITGGGTGGHLVIADAVKKSLNKQGIKPIYIGSTRGQDREWFEKEEGFEEAFFLPSTPVMNKGVLGKIKGLINILILSVKAAKILKKQNVKSVLSVGGYSAAPCAIGSLFSGCRLYIHEQNAVTGSLNRVLKPFATKFFSSFEENSKCKDYPVKEDFFEKRRVRENTETIIFLGGSQGAKDINDLALNLADFLKANNIKIIHQTGKTDFKRVVNEYQKKNIEAEVFPFTKDILEKIRRSDCAVARSGAGTLFELAANMVPSIFIPYPYAAGDHQFYNGKMLEAKGLAKVYRKEAINLEEIKEYILRDKTGISKDLENFTKRGGADCIASFLTDG